jgi:hypothetical protein
MFNSFTILIGVPFNLGTCNKVRNQTKRNPLKRNGSKPNETKIQNQNEMKNLSLCVSDYFRYLDYHYRAGANLFKNYFASYFMPRDIPYNCTCLHTCKVEASELSKRIGYVGELIIRQRQKN